LRKDKRGISSKPDEDGGELNEGKEAASKLVIASGNTTKLLKLLNKTLDQMAFFVDEPVTFPRVLFVGFGWDAVRTSPLCYIITDSSCAISFIGKHDSTI